VTFTVCTSSFSTPFAEIERQAREVDLPDQLALLPGHTADYERFLKQSI
jgi:hypothetical protein